MTPTRFAAFMERLLHARNTDDLLSLEARFAPFDEQDPLAVDALFHMAGFASMFARGPAPARATFDLEVPAPSDAAHRFTIRGRLGPRIVSVTWADGTLYGSRFAIGCIVASEQDRDAMRDPRAACARIRGVLAQISLEEGVVPEVA